MKREGEKKSDLKKIYLTPAAEASLLCKRPNFNYISMMIYSLTGKKLVKELHTKMQCLLMLHLLCLDSSAKAVFMLCMLFFLLFYLLLMMFPWKFCLFLPPSPLHLCCLTGNVEKIYVRRGGNGTLPCLPAEQVQRIFRLEWMKEDRKLVEVRKREEEEEEGISIFFISVSLPSLQSFSFFIFLFISSSLFDFCCSNYCFIFYPSFSVERELTLSP